MDVRRTFGIRFAHKNESHQDCVPKRLTINSGHFVLLLAAWRDPTSFVRLLALEQNTEHGT